ncbi:MAG: TAXI family TRAP transporter solute-binding subunit [Methylocella sp.]
MKLNATLHRMIGVLCVATIVGVAAWGWHFFFRPVVLSVAVGPPGFDDAQLVASMARALVGAESHIRFSIEHTSGPIESLERLRKRKAQLAVIRNLGDVPDRVRSIAILHSDPLTIIAPKSAKIENFRELANKTLGLIGPPGSFAKLMAWMRLHYGGRFLSIDIPPVAAEIAEAVNAKKIDALLFVAPTTESGVILERWASALKLIRKSMDVVSIDDAEAIETAAPVFDQGEIASGAFGGSPPFPAENVTTLLVTTYLVADQSVRPGIITELTRFIFENRQRFVPDAPVATLIKAASTDKDAIIPVHKGAEDFFDGEEQTFMDQYGDWIYTGPIILGALYSVVLAIWQSLRPLRPSREAPLLATVPEIICSVKNATSLENLEAISARVDAAIERISAEALDGKLQDSKVGASSLAIGHINRLMQAKRAELRSKSGV